MVTAQLDRAAEATVNTQENITQIAIGNYMVQIGSIHGGVVNIAMPEEQAHWQPRLTPVLLRPRRFTGLLDRKPETSVAATVLHTAQPLEFYGQSGWGKTTLLRHLAYDLPTASCPDGIVYLPAQQQPLTDLLQFLFEAFFESNIPARPTDAQIRHGLYQKRALILLDDVDLTRSDLDGLLDVAPHSAFFLASPERRLWGTAQTIALRGLPPEDALALLARELGRPFTTEEQAVAPTLCALLDGHPLHLLQVAALVRDQGKTLAEITCQLQLALPHEALAAQLLAALSTSERRVVGVLALLSGAPLSLEHVSALTGLPDPAPVLEDLLQRHLLQAHSPRYSLTGVLAQQWPAAWDLTPLAERVLTYFTRWAEQQPSVDRLLAETDTLRQILAWAVKSARWPETLRLARASEGALSLSGRWGAWAEMLQSGLQAAEALGDRAAKAWVWHQLGTRALCLDDVATARIALSRALRLRETLGDYAGAEVTRHNLTLLLGPPPPPQSPTKPPAPNGTAAVATGTPWLLLGLAGFLFVLLLTLGTWLGSLLFSSPPEIGQNDPPRPSTSAPEILPSPTATFTSTPTATDTPLPSPTFTPTTPAPTDTPLPTPTPTDTATPTPTATSPTATSTSTATSTPTPTATPVPVVVFNPTGLDFGQLRVGETSRTETVTLTNDGGGVLTVNSILLEGDNPNDYLIDAGNCMASPGFPANGNCLIRVRFRPTFVGNRRANLTFFTNDLDSPHRVFLTGVGLGDPAVSLNPGSLDFGERPVGSPSEEQTVTVTNVGQGDLFINSISLTGANPDDFSFAEPCTDFVMLPGDSCVITLRFIPQLAGLRTAELVLTDNAPNSPQHLTLLGVGLVTQPDVVITVLDFNGSAQINPKGEIEVPIRLVVKNQGNTEAGIFKVSTQYTGPDGTFAVAFTVPGQNSFWYPFTSAPLPAGSEVTFVGIVTFASRLQGQNVSLAALADSCSGDEFTPAYCRVEESREDNNLSGPLSTKLPTPPIIIE